MKKRPLLSVFVLVLMLNKLHAQDSLILADGKVLSGKVDAKSMEVLNNTQANINTTSTQLDHPGGKPEKVPNKNINYFIIGGVKYINHAITGGNKFMRVITEGKASLYYWAGNASVYGMHDMPGQRTTLNNGTVVQKQTEEKRTYSIANSVLFINGKNYTPNSKWLKKEFNTLFGDCKKLVEDSKKAGFNFDDLQSIVEQYNGCF